MSMPAERIQATSTLGQLLEGIAAAPDMPITGITDDKALCKVIERCTKRLIWLIDFKDKEVEPKEQKISKNGKWSKGRAISFDRMRS